MKKALPTLVLLVLILPQLFGQAVVREATGKVEIKSRTGSWQKAAAGMEVANGSTISTGFNSTAILDMEGSILQIKPLTRMLLEELVKTRDTISADLFLKVGKVKAEVKSVEGRVLNFKLRSPVATAAVRGTEFEFDGILVTVVNGEVTITNLNNQSRSVKDGEQSSSTGGLPSSGRQGKDDSTSVSTDTSPTGDGLAGDGVGPPPTTMVTVTWDWL